MQADDLESLLLGFVREQLGVDDPNLDRETALVSSGLVDSANLVRLATFVERNFEIRIADRDINAERFDSVARIVDLARKLRAS